MRDARQSQSRGAPSAFAIYLRTGRRVSTERSDPGLEFKFNPYHDPRNGQFTFGPGGNSNSAAAPSRHKAPERVAAKPRPAEQAPARPKPVTRDDGGFTGGGGGSTGGAGATGYYLSPQDVAAFKKEHPGMNPHLLLPGDTLGSVARTHGLSAARLAAINRLSVETKLRPGDVLAVLVTPQPKQSKPLSRLDKAGVAVHVATSRTEQYRHVVKNGYDFAADSSGRTREIDGTLTSNTSQKRDRRAQTEAGGADRLKTDHGGHYIARRFNGPTDAFNHFAQDGNFNKSRYAALENEWARAMASGQKVHVHIVSLYPGRSKRPSEIRVTFQVDKVVDVRRFPNNGDR